MFQINFWKNNQVILLDVLIAVFDNAVKNFEQTSEYLPVKVLQNEKVIFSQKFLFLEMFLW